MDNLGNRPRAAPAFSFHFVLLCVLVGLCVSGGATQAGESYPKHLVDVAVSGPEDLSKLASLGLDIAGVNRKAGTVGVVASTDDLSLLVTTGFSYTVRETRAAPAGLSSALPDYTDPQEMSATMDQIQVAYPTLAQKVVLKDLLFEGQKVYALKITKDVSQANDRPAFILDCQHHAREVMTPEIARDAMAYLTSRYATDTQVRNWVDNIVIWIVPSVNPDGAMYVFQHDNWWRKNRRPGCSVDLNRNYNFQWNACQGSSGSCADDTFRGTAGDSEPETQGMVQLFGGARATFGLTYHSYGEYLMYSYGCSDPNERAAMDSVAGALNTILQNDGGTTGQYIQGPIWSAIYKADGGSSDSEYGRFGTYAYCIEVNSSSFQPDYGTWRDITVQRQRTAWQFFLDKTLSGPLVRGKVTDASTGLPLQAQVSAQEVVFTHGEVARKADTRGLYHWLATPNTNLHLTFSLSGYCPVTRTASVGTGPLDLDVAMAPVSLSPPSGLVAAPGCPGVSLSWNPVPGAAGYNLYRASGSCPGTPVLLASNLAGTTTTDSSAVTGSTYAYTVRALTETSCESGASPCASAAAASAPDGPLAPSFSAVAASWVKLAWAAVPGASTYEVHRALGNCSGSFALRVKNIAGLTWTDTGLNPSTQYSYFVVASNSCGPGPHGACASVTTAAPPCATSCSAQVPATATAGDPIAFLGEVVTAGSCTQSPVWQWNFGDLTLSALQNPSHTYAQPGEYWWAMTVTVDAAACVKTGSITVVAPCSLDCHASSSPASGVAPLEVAFTATATASHCAGAPAFAWAFGDGQTSAESAPRHTYASAGSYPWTMTAAADGHTCTKSGVVTVSEPCTLTCDGWATPTSGTAPLEVAFAASATVSNCAGGPSFIWNFGDGQASAETVPRHTYTSGGTYAWTLVVTADGLSCSRAGTVTVGESCALECEASATPAAGTAPLEVAFTASVTASHCMGSPTYAWDFGDGQLSDQPSPQHTYSSRGIYSWSVATAVDGLSCTRTGTVAVESRLPGDADGDGVVTIGEVQQAVNMFLGTQAVTPIADCDGDGSVSIGEVQKVVNAFLGLAVVC